MIKLVSLIRSTKVILQVPPGSFVDICLDYLPKDKQTFLDRNFLIFKKAARIENYFKKKLLRSYFYFKKSIFLAKL